MQPKLEKEKAFGKVAEWFRPYFDKIPILYRLTSKTSRIYFTNLENESIKLYNSGTTLIKNYKDEEGERALAAWRVNLINSGKDPAVVLKERQDYGTLLHLIYGRILLGETSTYEELPKFALSSAINVGFKKENAEVFVEDHIKELEKDIAAFVKWIKDYEVEPIAIELMMKTDLYQTGTAIDLVADIVIDEKGFFGEVYKSGANKGQPKETKQRVKKRVIVDFKSGKSIGFYPSNILQLLLNRVIWEENFPDLPIDGVFNFSPSDWRTSPSYQFYDQERDTKETKFLNKWKENIFERGLGIFTEKILPKTEITLSGDFFSDDTVKLLTLAEIAEKYFAYDQEEENAV